MTNWGKYKNVNVDELNKEVDSLGDGEFPEIPNGKYEVALDSLELKPTKEKGYPMLAARFTIVEGQYKNMKLFVNQVVIMGDENDKYRVRSANTFLKSLGSKQVIHFEGVEEYEKLIDDVADECVDMEYLLKKGKNKGGYDTYEILDIYE